MEVVPQLFRRIQLLSKGQVAKPTSKLRITELWGDDDNFDYKGISEPVIMWSTWLFVYRSKKNILL